ncbi:MAG: aminomethyl-transferring glycine dehydrogenase subunit GcvPA [Candidatus Omnitrophica bacterium]|nr:aminomethyl-transferring glycine dehydrogenase subunit GcvPA [Candidatus Omnitrophota bacterium]MDD5573755.1 aminomethyl-transferring glycine dehydrogenase subunit GcvPA [Candidatus Omnitrophota bacterium]
MPDHIANTSRDTQEMLARIGVPDTEALFSVIKKSQRAHSFDLPPGRSEFEVIERLKNMAKKNAGDLLYFTGAGFYDHYIPPVVDHLSSRSEFYTAYTPYQPECSQGTLQAIYEYQSVICRLTGMEIANASLYDGGTALYEAMMVARRMTGRNRVLVDSAVSPIYRTMLTGYTKNLEIEFVEIPVVHGQTDRAALKKNLDEKTACVILQNPNFFGAIDDHADIVAEAHRSGAIAIASVYPVSLGFLKTPAACGFDLATGEGQSLGLPLSFGGPYLGFMAAKKELARKMPGRIVGATVDTNGKRGFVLTLQAREQHIRREKATSNICSNEALCALRAVIYLSCLGKQGLTELAELNYRKAEYLKNLLAKIKGVEVKRSSPTFNEFTVVLPRDPNAVVAAMLKKGFAAGFPLGRYYKDMERYMIVAVTEKLKEKDLALYAKTLEEVLWS